PSAFVFLDALPWTVHGKVDRQALPDPELQREGEGVAPRNPVEEQVAAVFREVLGIDRVGVDDSFFALGGHSLLATRATFRLSAVTGVPVPVTALFEAPTVAGLAEWLEHAGGETDEGATSLAPPAPESGLHPLSLAQRRLWFLSLLEPGNPLYNLPVPLRLVGRLDVSALGRALARIVRRHEPLRTVYAEQGGEPVQVVLPPPVAPPLARLSLSTLPGPARSAALDAILGAEERLPFDLERGPVARFRLVELGPEEQVLIATFHHIATDGWSMGVFARELGALYAGSTLPELPLCYADVARRERQDLARGLLERQLDFWRDRLAGLPILELPADRRPPHPGPRGASRPFDLPVDLAAALAAFGRGAGLTPFTVLLAGFATLLARLSSQDDFGIGVPSSGRSRPETEGMIGFFVNTLVLRPELGGDPPFAALARRMQDAVVAAQANQEVPFETLVEALQPERAPGLTPFFQVMFAFLNDPQAPASSLSLPGLSATLIERDPPLAEFDLTLSIHEWEGRLRGGLQYRVDLFDAPTVARWAGHLRTLLAGAAADPARPLSALPLLSAAERRQLAEWSGEPVAAVAATLHQRFEEQVERAPDAVALVAGVAGEAALSYGEMEARANRLARHLLALGIGLEARIAVCLDRSAELDLVLLAVLKAGGVHLPLDPSYPPERMRVILEDAGAAVLVSDAGAISRLPLEGLRVAPATVLLDRDAAAIARHDAVPSGVEVDPHALAYIIYTSGSTGRPKGVGVPHGAVTSHVDAVRHAYGIGPRDRALQFSSPGFDVSIEQVLVALSSGAALVLRGAELWTPSEMTRRIAELQITYLDLPTAYWNRWASDAGDAFAESIESGDPGDRGEIGPSLPLRVVVAGGEEMLAGNVRQWLRSPLAGARLLNGYGPTEVVVTVTLHEVDPDDGEAAGRRTLPPIPLGRPVAGNSVRVLDRFGQPQPLGVPGEICVGGPQARGYLERPELTAARFPPDPFSGQPGTRLYKTGDRGRTRPDGRLEFLGRIDEQVKVRGFRIELGEVEAALTRHPAVREAAVLALPAGSGASRADRTLAAWVVPAMPAIGDGADLAVVLGADLRALLPEYMVPTAWVVLAALPLNAHGKIDRRALPPPARTATGEAAGRAPASPEEELLGELYAELLDRPRVGMDDSFFQLGGHSLLATQLASRVRAVFGIELPLAAIFEAPTPAALALRLKALRRARAATGAEPLLVPTATAAPAPLSFSQQRLWFLNQLEPDDAYHVPGALRLRGLLREAVLARALEQIVRRHEALRTVFPAVEDGRGGRGAVQVVLPPVPLELPTTDLVALPAAAREAEAARLLAAEGRRPFDLAAGPLVRTLLLRLAAEERLLSVVMHHITSDAWSLGILLAELEALYTAFLKNEPSPLADLPLQYPDFARWQRRFLSGEGLEREVRHWRQALAGAPDSLPLPYDRPPGSVVGNRGGRRPFALGAELHGRLAALARREGWTAFMTLLAGFQALLARLTGQEDLVVGSPIANRTRRKLEGLIGFFTNTVALRLDLAGDPSFRALGRRVRSVALDAYAHQDLPFEKLVEELAPDRHLGRNPLFQVMLVLQRLPPVPVLPEVEVELVDVDSGVAKFDLTLLLFEEGGGMAAGTGGMEYARALFDEATVERLLGNLRTLLAGAAAHPEARLSELPLLSTAEIAELAAWTRPLQPTPPPLLVHAEVAAQAGRTPDAL
ncbi:MAG TPA: amino acid adenylation domain-containing protein, partial [Thermoanaerobaculia bacterium]|nr:amino acid adenylation domain-containing protein [Thermoanaerobaculia bacterium]